VIDFFRTLAPHLLAKFSGQWIQTVSLGKNPVRKGNMDYKSIKREKTLDLGPIDAKTTAYFTRPYWRS
jgi:hypothetical protein